jgi:hypothetical protein
MCYPVINEASSEHSQTTASATSSGSPRRAIGWAERILQFRPERIEKIPSQIRRGRADRVIPDIFRLGHTAPKRRSSVRAWRRNRWRRWARLSRPIRRPPCALGGDPSCRRSVLREAAFAHEGGDGGRLDDGPASDHGDLAFQERHPPVLLLQPAGRSLPGFIRPLGSSVRQAASRICMPRSPFSATR